ncbi:hypothetical protein Cflav_PD4619 [Pedosphaera parvula Ellin514]|uniref:Uncharacterized protein n=1 Tax=Pedosphaera parvula (strain Ellin514) TaxID=320771 RepID=B9XE65_PEDPL|nr:hypothetical protein Cflav_PD4619 [Pedosphaera parvula Ellin514]
MTNSRPGDRIRYPYPQDHCPENLLVIGCMKSNFTNAKPERVHKIACPRKIICSRIPQRATSLRLAGSFARKQRHKVLILAHQFMFNKQPAKSCLVENAAQIFKFYRLLNAGACS